MLFSLIILQTHLPSDHFQVTVVLFHSTDQSRGLTETMTLCFLVQVMVPGSQNHLLLKPLLSDTEYKVTVTPIYDDGEGVSVSAPGKTCE